jgi:hypothetical protein
MEPLSQPAGLALFKPLTQLILTRRMESDLKRIAARLEG